MNALNIKYRETEVLRLWKLTLGDLLPSMMRPFEFVYYVEYFTVGRLRYEPPIGYSKISLSLYLKAELIAGTGLKTYQFLKGKQGLISPKALF